MAADYFTVDTWNSNDSTSCSLLSWAPNPNQESVSQQAWNLSWDLQAQSSQARFLICDNDKKFPSLSRTSSRARA